MPNDPNSRRTSPAPLHPDGFLALDDCPAHLAPPLDVRVLFLSLQPSTLSEPPPSSTLPLDLFQHTKYLHKITPYSNEQTTATQSIASSLPPLTGMSAISTPTHLEIIPESERMPNTIDFERSPQTVKQLKHNVTNSSTIHAESLNTNIVHSVPQNEISQALIAELNELNLTLTNTEQTLTWPIAARVQRARARALRVRLSFFQHKDLIHREVQDIDSSLVHKAIVTLCLEAGLLFTFADESYESIATSVNIPAIEVLLKFLRTKSITFPYSFICEQGAQSVSHLTIVGWATALEKFKQLAEPQSFEIRNSIFEFVTFCSEQLACTSHHTDALNELVCALGFESTTA